MSIALLLEKYDVSSAEGLQKALNEIEKEEYEVNDALANALSKACTLEGRLRSASQAYTKLGEVKNDAQVAADMVEKTATLARDVSAKVRQLDLARSRVAECQRRVNDLIDLKVCSAGVDAAIKAHDYETAAGHIARFLSMEPGSVAAARARGDTDPRLDITSAANTLRDHLVKKFDEASKKEDDEAVERLFKLFPQIGYAEQGVDLLAKYVAAQLETRVRRASVVAGNPGEGAVYADALTRALEAAAERVERVRALSAPAPRALPRALALLQPAVSSGVRGVCRDLVSALGGAGGAPGGRAGAGGARSVEPALTELAIAHSRIQMYCNFLRRRVDLNVYPDEAARLSCAADLDKIISDSEMTRYAQDILMQYLTLERYYLEESVNKALKLSNQQAGVTSSSLVDDVFFIVRKVIRRGVSTGSLEGACCAVNEAGAQLERAAGALSRRLARPPPDPLPLPSPPRARRDRDATPLHLTAEHEAQRALYFSQAAEAESGAEWSERVAAEACELGDALCRGEAERGKLRSCASQLSAAAAAFRDASRLARAALRAAMLDALADWARQLVDARTDPEEAEEDANALPSALDVLAEEVRNQMPNCADTFLADVVNDIVTRAEKYMAKNYYDRESAACVERRCRRLAAWVGWSAGGAREACANLTRAACHAAHDAGSENSL